MVTLRITADIPSNRQLTITLPPEVPVGQSELEIIVGSPILKQPQPGGVSAASILGIAAGNGSPPDDETVQRWIREHRTEKYG